MTPKLSRRLAAYGSSGGLEESAQDGDLEERVERHVVCAQASGCVSASASRRARACGLLFKALRVRFNLYTFTGYTKIRWNGQNVCRRRRL